MAHHARLLIAATDLATDTTAERFDGETHGGGVVAFSGEVTFTVEGSVSACRHPATRPRLQVSVDEAIAGMLELRGDRSDVTVAHGAMTATTPRRC